MAVVLRLSRAGAKKQPFYHIVATDSRNPRDGRFLDQVGRWDPRAKKLDVDSAKLEKWLKNGALPSETVKDLLAKAPKA
jgi:small subunit ribosomal protein S16